jgi:secreted trypsin-like serine protease
LPSVLQQGVLKVINENPFCTSDGKTYNVVTNYCAFDADNVSPFTNACNGDSGGPLQLWDGVRATVYGIVSYGYIDAFGCANYEPSYYTNVPTFLEWILNKINIL